jgi:Tol biopolymer transport system component
VSIFVAASALGMAGACPNACPADDEIGIFVMRVDGSGVRKVVAVDGYDHHTSPRWSHDGKRLAFDALDAAGGRRKFFTVNVDGSDLQERGEHSSPDWSPDDKQLVYYSEGGGDAQEGVWVQNVDGSGRTWVTAGAWPRWSPDASQLAVAQSDAIHIVDLTTGEERSLSQHLFPQRPGSFGWSRDGKRIAFFVRSMVGGPRELYIANADAPNQQLTPRYARMGMVGGHVSWTPDDKQLIFTIDSYIHVMDVEGDGEPTRIAGQEQHNRDPACSPDGKWIAFARRN